MDPERKSTRPIPVKREARWKMERDGSFDETASPSAPVPPPPSAAAPRTAANVVDSRLLAAAVEDRHVEFVTSVIHDINGRQFNRNMRVAIRTARAVGRAAQEAGGNRCGSVNWRTRRREREPSAADGRFRPDEWSASRTAAKGQSFGLM